MPNDQTPIVIDQVSACTPSDTTAVDAGEVVTMTFKFLNKTGGTLNNAKILLISDPTTGVAQARPMHGGPGGTEGVLGDAASPIQGAVVANDGPMTVTFRFIVTPTATTAITPRFQLYDGFVLKADQTFAGQDKFKIGYTQTGIVNTYSFTGGPISLGAGITVGQLTPYRSVVNVPSAVSGTITRVTVRLNGFNVSVPDDMQVLLVRKQNFDGGEADQKVLLMANAGGFTAVNFAAPNGLAFRSSGTDIVAIGNDATPEISTSKNYLPSVYGPDTYVFPADPADGNVAPQPPFGSSLDVFLGAGSKAKGDWVLYVADDSFGGTTTSIASWDLIIETSQYVTPSTCTTRPTFTVVPANQSVNEDGSVEQLVTVVDQDAASGGTPAKDLQVTLVSSSDTTIIPASGVTITRPSDSGDRIVKITPAANQPLTSSTGKVVNIKIKVTDGIGLLEERSFDVTVNPVNDEPTISSIGPQSTQKNTNLTVPFTVGDVETPASSLVVFAEVLPSAAAAPFTVELGGSGTDRSVTIKPKTDAIGFGSIKLTVVDNGQQGSTIDTKLKTTEFNVSVGTTTGVPVVLYIKDGATTIAEGAQVSLVEDFGTKTYQIGIFDNATPVNSLQVTAVSSNPGVFLSPLEVSAEGSERTLTIKSAPNQYTLIDTPAVITVTVKDTDNLTGSATFKILVTPQSDRPTIALAAGGQTLNPTIAEDTALTFQVALDDPESGPGGLTLTATSSDTAKVPVSNISMTPPGPISPKTIAIVPAANQFGGPVTLTINVTDTDGNTAATPVTVNLTITPVNDAPVFTKGADISVVEDSGLKEVNDWATGVSDVEGHTIVLVATPSNAALINGAITFASGSAGDKKKIQFTPAANKYGTTAVTVVATDYGPDGVAGGGDDSTSAPQTFNITITQKNDAPTASINSGIYGGGYALAEDTTTPPAPGTYNADTKVFTLPGVIINILPEQAGVSEERSQTVTPLLTANDNTGLFDGAPSLSLNSGDYPKTADLKFKLKANANGTANLKFKIQDNGGTADSGADLSGELSFAIVITPVPDKPTITDLPAAVIAAKNETKNIVFTVNDVDVADQSSVNVTITGQVNPPLASLSIAKSGGVRAVTLIPTANYPGPSDPELTITLTVTAVDDSGNPANDEVKTFTYKVTSQNTPPTIGALVGSPAFVDGAIRIKETELASVTFTVDDLETPPIAGPPATNPDRVKVTASANNTTVFPAANVLLDTAYQGGVPDYKTRKLILIPATYKFGSNIVVTITAEDTDPDDAGPLQKAVTTKTFTIHVEDVNQSPALTGGVFANSPAKAETFEDETKTVPFTINDPDTGDTMTVTATAATEATTEKFNTGLIDTMTPSSTGVVIVPKANQSGLTKITVVANDGRGGADTKTFYYTVNPVNDSPTISGLADVSTTEKTNLDINYSVADVDSTKGDKKLVVNVSVASGGDIVEFDNNPSTDANDTGSQTVDPGAALKLRIKPKSDANGAGKNGTAKIRVTVTDRGWEGLVGAFGGTDNNVVLAEKTTTQEFTVTVNPVNATPTISPIADATVNEDQETGPIVFSIADNDSDVSKAKITVTSSNQSVVADAGISLSGVAGTRTLNIKPVANAFGISTITVVVSDENSFDPKTAERQFKVTVNSVNDAPVFTQVPSTPGANDFIDFTADVGYETLVKFNDVDDPVGNVIISGFSANETVVPSANVQFNQTAVPGEVRVKIRALANNSVGTATITLRLTDGKVAVPTSATFKVRVTPAPGAPVGDPPVLTPLVSKVSFSESQTISPIIKFTVFDQDDPGLGAGTRVTASSSNKSLVKDTSIFLGSDVTGTNRTMTVLIEVGQSGTTVVTLTGTDANGNKDVKTVTIEVVPVNAAPTIGGLPATLTIEENKNTGPIAFTVTDRESDPALVKVSGKSSNTSLVPDASIVFGPAGAASTVLIVPAANQSGTAVITLTAEDEGGLKGTATMTLTVTPVNDAPTIAPSTIPPVVIKDVPSATVVIVVDDQETPAGSIDVKATSSNASIVAAGGLSVAGTSATRTITVTPIVGVTGTTTVTITATDGGGAKATVTVQVTVIGTNADDIDGDGLSDLVFQNRDGWLAFWAMQNGSQKSTSFLNPPNVGEGPWKVVGSGNFGGTPQADLVFQNSDGTLAVWIMDGINQISSALLNPSSAGAGWRVAAVADFNADGSEDLLFQNSALGGTLAVWYMDGLNQKSSELVNPLTAGAGWNAVGAADVMGLGATGPDGKIDILFQNTDGTIAVWAMDGINRIDADVLNPANPGSTWRVVGVSNMEAQDASKPEASQADLILQSDSGLLQIWNLRGLNAPIRSPVSSQEALVDWSVVAPK